MPSPLRLAFKLASSPAGRKAVARAVQAARSEEGRKLIAQARKVATSPEWRKLIEQARRAARLSEGAVRASTGKARLGAVRTALRKRKS